MFNRAHISNPNSPKLTNILHDSKNRVVNKLEERGERDQRILARVAQRRLTSYRVVRLRVVRQARGRG